MIGRERIPTKNIEIILTNFIIESNLIVAFFTELYLNCSTLRGSRCQIIRINHGICRVVLVISVSDDQSAAPHVSFLNTEVFIVTIGITANAEHIIAVQLIDILLQLKPQGDGITNLFSKKQGCHLCLR